MNKQQPERYYDVCVFGSYNIDVVVKVPRFPNIGESLVGTGSYTGIGGKGVNQAVAASRAGSTVHYIGKVGSDDFSVIAKNYIEKSEIDKVTLLSSQEKPTGKSLIFVTDDNAADNMIAVDPGANFSISKDEVTVLSKSLGNTELLLLQLENNIDAIENLIESAVSKNLKIILNPAPYQLIDDKFLACIDIVTPNETEIELMTNIKINSFDDAKIAAQKLHDKKITNVIITLGEKGVFLSTENCAFHIPPYPTDPIDTTGAGDAFNGALASELAKGSSLIDACLFANAYAACAVEHKGAAEAMPSRSEALNKMKENIIKPIRL